MVLGTYLEKGFASAQTQIRGILEEYMEILA